VSEPIVIGLDGGGTYTRAAAADLRGNVLSRVTIGGSNPSHAPDAEANTREAIRLAIEQSGRRPEDVAALVADDAVWAERFTALPGLNCPRVQLNDAVVAHHGAFVGGPGVLAISGTGSIVFGVTETGRHVRNYDFAHYALTTARHVTYETLFRILMGEFAPDDASLVATALKHWDMVDVDALRGLASGFHSQERQCRNYRAGAMAPLVTAAAEEGSGLARAVCDEIADRLSTGIRLVGSCFALPVVPVALVGGVARSGYLSRAVVKCLSSATGSRYEVVEPVMPAVCGALLMALERLGIRNDNATVDRLSGRGRSG
jgi:glucosamine kinase